MTVTPPAPLDPAHVARIELAYAAHLRALHAAFGFTPRVVDYNFSRDYVGLPALPRDLQLRASLEGGLVVEAYEFVPGRGSGGLFCPRGNEPGEWRISIARCEAVDHRAPFEYNRPPRIKVGLSEIAWAYSTDRSPHNLAQTVGNAIHSAVGTRSA